MQSDDRSLQIKSSWLLPNSFKRIGLAVLLSTILCALLLKAFGNAASIQQHSYIFKPLLIGLLALGALLLVFAREKVENEEVRKRRLVALITALVTSVLIIFVQFIMDGWPTDKSYLVSFIIQVILFYSMNCYWTNIRFKKMSVKS